MYRIIVSDMDETFLDANRAIPAKNLEALRRMRELGILFVPSSGRPYASIMDNFAGIDQDLLTGSYVISYNGGCINRYGEREPLVSSPMESGLAEELYREGLDLGLGMHVYTTDGCIYTQRIPEIEWENINDITGVERVADGVDVFELVAERPIAKIIYMHPDFAEIQHLVAQLRPALAPRGIDVTHSSRRYVELMPAGIDKGTGLIRLAELLGIDPADTIAVGDSANDLAMLQAAGLGVGVANVTDDTRPACDLVLETAGVDGAFGELMDRVFGPSRTAPRA